MFLLEGFDGLVILDLSLLLNEMGKFDLPLSLFLLFLLLGQGEFFVSNLPELGEFFLLSAGSFLLGLTSLHLHLSTLINGLLHLKLTALLLLEETVCLVLGLSYLLVENLLLVIFDGAELLNLPVDHLLSDGLLLLEAGLLSFLTHGVSILFRFLIVFNASGLHKINLLESLHFGDLGLVRIDEVRSHLSSPLLFLELLQLFPLNVFFNLPLDKFTLEHFFL